MRMQLRSSSSTFWSAMAMAIGVTVPQGARADVITINDGAQPGTTDIPFTCALGSDGEIWLPAMGFVYRNIEPFALAPGDTIAFDIQLRASDPPDLGFLPQLDIALAHASDPQKPFKPDDLPGSDFTTVAHAAIAASAGNHVAGDYDLVFTVDTPFRFAGGGLIIRVSHPVGALATRDEAACLPVITADRQPSGSNRLVGTFVREAGEYPWSVENTAQQPGVPYVRIAWTRCGDGLLSGAEVCDDGNSDDTDDCSSACQRPTCGDGIVQQTEECDNSAYPGSPDPYCNDACHLAAFAKGSGCSTGGGAGLVAALAVLALVRRRRAAASGLVVGLLWTGSADAQRRTDGFRVDRFEMAPSVEDGLVVQDPRVLGHLSWSLSATLGFSDTLLRVVPRLSADTGVDVVGTRLSTYLDFAMGFSDRFEVNVSVPFAMMQTSESGSAAGMMLNSAGKTAMGDARVGGSVLLVGRSTGPQVGVAASVAVPVGSRDSFTGDGGLGAELLATAGYPGPGYRLLANAGVRLRPEADYVSTDQGTELVGRAGIFVPVASPRLIGSLELDMTTRAAGRDAFRRLGSPVLAMLGARHRFPSGMHVGAGGGLGLTAAPGNPSWRVLVTVGYSPEHARGRATPRPGGPDRDGDGIADALDGCPDQPEDVNGVHDEDGCPDLLERDRDHIADHPPEPGPLTIEQVLTMPAAIEFQFDTAIMLPGSEKYLRQALDLLQQHAELLKIEIQGHTSSEGGAEYNMRLSNDRAQAVFNWLVEHGIDKSRLVPRGYGLTQPVLPNDTEPHRQRNRRVQFRLLEPATLDGLSKTTSAAR